MYLVDEKPWKELLRILLSTALLYEVLWKWDLGFFFIFLCPFTIMSEVFESRRFLACLQSKTPMRLLCSSRAVSVWPLATNICLRLSFVHYSTLWTQNIKLAAFTVKLTRTWTPEIFLECYCVLQEKSKWVWGN